MSVSSQGSAKPLFGFPLWLLPVVLFSLALMALRIGGAFEGFHGFNEAFYTIYARNYFGRPVQYLLTGATDFNNPPLLSYLLFLSFKIFGVGETQARLVPIVFSLLTIVYTYKLGAFLYGTRAGQISAALLSVMPGFVLVGRNVQTEAVFVFFSVASLFYYLKSTRERTVRNKCLAGLLLGLGVLAKWPAALVVFPIGAWEFSRTKNFAWLNKKFGVFLLTALAVPSPWLFYHLLVNRDVFLAQQGVRAATFQLLSWPAFINFMLIEFVWMVSPLILVLIAAFVVGMVRRKHRPDFLPAAGGIVYAFFYLFYHQHSYYMFPLLVFSALVSGKLLDAIPEKRLFFSVSAIIVVATAFLSLLVLSGHKYGYSELRQLREIVGRADAQKKTVWVSPRVHSRFEPIITYYSGAKVVAKDNISTADIKGISENEAVFTLFMIPSGKMVESEGKIGLQALESTVSGLALFGTAFFQVPPDNHFFRIGKVQAVRTGGIGTFGIVPIGKRSTWAILDLNKYREFALANREF